MHAVIFEVYFLNALYLGAILVNHIDLDIVDAAIT